MSDPINNPKHYTTKTIEFHGIPDGYKPVAYRAPNRGELYLSPHNTIREAAINYSPHYKYIIVEKEARGETKK